MNIGAGWIRESKDGKKYLSCQVEIPFLGKINFALFHLKDEEKKSENAPDYHIVWSAPRKNSDGRSAEENNPDNNFNDSVPF